MSQPLEYCAALAAAFVLLGPQASAGSTLRGPVFTISADAGPPAVAKDPRGGFCVAWASGALGEVFARRYGADDRALTEAVSVGWYDYYTSSTSVAATGQDRYWVAWDSYGKYSGSSAQARSFGPTGAPGRSVPVGFAPSIAPVGRSGEWAAAGVSARGLGLQIRDARGGRRAAAALGKAQTPRTVTSSGDTVWVVATMHGGIVAHHVGADGRLLRSLPVTTRQVGAVAAGNATGDLVVAWTSDGFIFARWLSPARDALGRIVLVAPAPAGPSTELSAAMDAAGKTLLVWNACCDSDISGRRFERGGSPAGPVIALTSAPAYAAAVAAAKANDFILVWEDSAGMRGQSLAWARPGDELCLFAEGKWSCDLAHDGGEAELRESYGGERPATPLLGDFDGDGRDDFCLARGGTLRCDTAHDEGSAETAIPLLAGHFDALLTGDLDGEGRDDLCAWRDHALACDTAHDGGSAEVVVDLPTAGGRPLLGDLDGDGDDDPCAALGGVFRCDLDHDGDADAEIGLDAEAGEEPLLGDLDGDGRAEPCLYDGARLRCDTAHDGGAAEFAIDLDSGGAAPLLGNPDGI